MATSTGSSPPSGPGPSTEQCQALPSSGGSSLTVRANLAVPVTGDDHWSRRRTSSAPARVGASNARPSREASTVSATSVRDLGSGGGAGTSRRWAAMVQMVATRSLSTDWVKARPSWRLPAVAAAPGRTSASSAMTSGSIRAGSQLTWNVERSGPLPPESSRRRSLRRRGTIRPWATSRTARAVVSPSQGTVAPMPSSSAETRWATSQPRVEPIGATRLSAFVPSSSRMGRCSSQGIEPPPAACSRARTPATSSLGAFLPPAHAMRTPGSHDSCSWVTPTSWSSPTGPGPSGFGRGRWPSGTTSSSRGGPRSSVRTSSMRNASRSKSSMMTLRSGPRTSRLVCSMTRSALSRKRYRTRTQSARNRSRMARCSSVARPSRWAWTIASKSLGSTFGRRSGPGRVVLVIVLSVHRS